MAVLLDKMLKETNDTFACVAFGDVKGLRASRGGRIETFVVPGPGHTRTTNQALTSCKKLVEKWGPHLIHIHGTEGAYGLLTARGLVNCPAVISLQGLLGPYSEWYRYFGNSSLRDVFRMHRVLDFPAMRGQWIQFLKYRMMAKRERELIVGNENFIGRTTWDKAYIRALNPIAKYYYGGELLRDVFWRKEWNIQRARRYRIICTNAGHPRKGVETLLDATKLLQAEFPDIQVAILGGISRRSGYGRYMLRRIEAQGDRAIELGPRNAEYVSEELLKSHIFVSPSYIDNSPNALCEAQLMGMPVIATYTGGVPSLVEDGRTGVFVPTGDAPMLAERIREVFSDDAFAMEVGCRARVAARRRHDATTVIRQLTDAYSKIVSRNG